MNEYDDILNRIVEEFYDTGRLVLNEIHSDPWFVKKIRGLLSKAKSNYSERNYEEALSNYRSVLEIYNGLKDGQKNSNSMKWFDVNIPISEINRIEGLITPEEPIEDEIEVDIDLDGSEEDNTQIIDLDDLQQQRLQNTIQNVENYNTDDIRNFFDVVKTDLEELYHREGSVKDKFKDYSKIIAKPPVGRYPMMYYYEIDSAKESQNLTDDFIKNKRKELLHLNHAKNNLEILTKGLGLNYEDLLEGENINNRIESLERTLNLESYGEGDELPLFRSGHIIFEEDEFWLKLLENSDKNVEVGVYEEQQPNGEINKYLVYNGDEITIDDWKRTFCTEKNYERYKTIIDSNDISCDIFRGDPNYYDFSVGQKVKFRENVRLNKGNGEESYYECAEKIKERLPLSDKIKKRAFILKITEINGDKVNLSYDYGDGIDLPLFRNGWDGCPQKGEIKNVDIRKLEPYEKTERDTYLGAQQYRRRIFDQFKEEAERLNLSDLEYNILSNQLMEFAGNLQRLGIESGNIDLRTRRVEIISGGTYTPAITRVVRDLTSNVDPEGATVLSLYENLKNKIFKGATTEQVRLILPYLMEINERLKGINNITQSNIVNFVNELDFEKPEKLDDTFRQIIINIAEEYEGSFCCDENKYFKNCKSKEGDKSVLLKRGENNKTMTDLIESSSGTTDCAKILYNKIISDTERRIDKYDIISNNEVILDNFTIPNDKKIEVKSYNTSDGGYTLSEFISIYKIKDNIQTYKNENTEYYQRYNEIVEEVVRLLNGNDGGIKDSFLGEDKLFGVFLKDYTFYHYKNMDLEWSTISDQKRFRDEKRITVRFTLNGEGHRWVEGNCNLQQNESTDRLDEIIENFFDTGKFVF